ncbi:hypothetical protein [Nocardioides sp. B-3]|uniref:hypothetical protein n=1 Tax=Nocardioides sp. B-3 TaxID=2895565 RepID=UPI003FA5A1F2
MLGHSRGPDLAVRYAFDHPDRVRGVVGSHPRRAARLLATDPGLWRTTCTAACVEVPGRSDVSAAAWDPTSR